MKNAIMAFVLSSIAAQAPANEVQIIDATARISPDGSYRFDITLSHSDSGWDHYADRWEILTPDGKLIATRVLHHPHVNEQPFTRSLSRVHLPRGLKQVVVRAHDKVHGDGTQMWTLDLQR